MNTIERPVEPLPVDVIAALQQGNKIEAIKRLRDARNLDLKAAKDRVDDYVRNDPALTRKYREQSAGIARVLWFIIFATLAMVLLYLFA